MKLKTFKPGEYVSPHISYKEAACSCCNKLMLDMDFVNLLETLRNRLNVPMHFSRSFYRCPKHNKEVGGASQSTHTKGCADDFDCYKKLPAMKVLDEVHKVFGCRFGIYQSRDPEMVFFHVDNSNVNKSMWISRLVNGHNQYTYYNDYDSLINALKNDKKINWSNKWC